jgi:D-3-phosphoglycerate dehydrogenase
VNCAHAGLVDEEALVQALANGHLGGAAIDTFTEEPPPPGHPLLRLPNVVVAPHLNQNTEESQSATSQQVVEDVQAALRGEDYRHVVNLPFHEGSPERRPISYRAVKPYIQLAVKLGKLQGQLAEGWITRVEVEILGEGVRDLVRPVAAVLLTGMLRPVGGRAVNWVSAPVLAYEQEIVTAQAKELVRLADYPNLIACRIYWKGGHRTVAGVLFGNGEARLVQYDHYPVDAIPEGYVLVLENEDVPGVIGKIGTRLGQAGINIAQWRYGREARGGKAVSFINLDARVPKELLAEIKREPEIHRAKVVFL